MTLENLHDIPNFTGLFTDARFVGLMIYLRKRRPKASQKEPHGMIQDSGKLDAYLSLLDTMEEAQFLPSAKAPEASTRIPYGSEQLPISKENK